MKPLIFISCGQSTEGEIRLGQQVSAIVEGNGFAAYFAQNQETLQGVTENILKKLNEAVGFIAILHPRGNVGDGRNRQSWIRGSVWVEQEIAIAAFVSQALDRSLAVKVFIHESIKREGLRDKLHLNPTQFADDARVLDELRNVLPGWRNAAPLTQFPLRDGDMVRITPIRPPGHDADLFRVATVLHGDGSLILNKQGSSHQVSLPLNRMEVFSTGPGEPKTIELKGRLQWVTLAQQWRYFPEAPSDAIGVPKPPDDARIASLGGVTQLGWANSNTVGTAYGSRREVVFDDDGRYFLRPDRPFSQILVKP